MTDVPDAGPLPQSPSNIGHGESVTLPVQAFLGRKDYTSGPQYTSVGVKNEVENVAQGPPAGSDNRNSQLQAGDKNTYVCESDRLRTFEAWKSEYPVSPVHLARNGFIYRGPDDKVMCVFCFTVISNWADGADVECTHRFLQSECPIFKTENNNKPITRQSINERLSTLNPAVPAFVDEMVRLDSFKNWPATNCMDPKALAEAGFFYKPVSGKKDRVKCFMCGKVLLNWEPADDPWREHGRISKDCKFVREIKGQDFLKDCGKQTPTSSAGTPLPSASDSNFSGEDPSKHIAVQAVLQSQGSRYSLAQVIKAFRTVRLQKGDAISAAMLLEKLMEDEA